MKITNLLLLYMVSFLIILSVAVTLSYLGMSDTISFGIALILSMIFTYVSIEHRTKKNTNNLSWWELFVWGMQIVLLDRCGATIEDLISFVIGILVATSTIYILLINVTINSSIVLVAAMISWVSILAFTSSTIQPILEARL